MAVRKLTPEKRALLAGLIGAYDIETTGDIQLALKNMLGDTIQHMLETELDATLGYDKHARTDSAKTNYRNGHKRKRLKSTLGEVAIDMPQDRNSEFEPKIVPKHSTNISDIEQKIINMYARGQTTREISEQIADIYGFEASAEMISKITDKVLPQIEEWQSRRLSEVYPIVFIDAVVFSVRRDKVVDSITRSLQWLNRQ